MNVKAKELDNKMEIFVPNHGYVAIRVVEFKNGLVYVTDENFAELVFYPDMEIPVRRN